MSEAVINDKALLLGFPSSLCLDGDKEKLAKCIAPLLAQILAETDKASVYTQIDKLPEGLLDMLAVNFRVEWYDYEGSLEEKRRTIKECMFIHRYKGTKFAVETALKTVYDKAYVNEWFEYGGKPFHFAVTINDSTNDQEKRTRILEKVQYYKNLRSVLDSITFATMIDTAIIVKIGITSKTKYKRTGGRIKAYGLE